MGIKTSHSSQTNRCSNHPTSLQILIATLALVISPAGSYSEGSATMKILRKAQFMELMQNPQRIIAPMVEQSDVPFRVLCKLNGATMAFTQVTRA